MIPQTQREQIIALINREVVPAIGCTEPIAVALCVARATEIMGETPTSISLRLSANVLKNAMGVGIPGTGMIGLPIAIALGAIKGKSDYELEVLRDVTDKDVELGRKYVDEKRISISLLEDAPSKLHIEATVTNAVGESCIAIISGTHTNFIYLRDRNREILNKQNHISSEENTETVDYRLNLSSVWEFATESPKEELMFILEAAKLNKNAALSALDGEYGHSLGSTIHNHGKSLYGDTPLEHMLTYTSAACDARMAGAMIPVMSNSGSGNQGITATMPVVSYAEDINADEEHTARALILSHLTSIYIKQSLGRLSALCGCVVASTGASCALVYLMGGGFKEVTSAVKNMIANLTGMICDGAKPSCAMKISSGVSTAMMSAMLAMHGKCVSSAEGIVDEDVDITIHNLTSIGREAMNETDRHVLRIMTCK